MSPPRPPVDDDDPEEDETDEEEPSPPPRRRPRPATRSRPRPRPPPVRRWRGPEAQEEDVEEEEEDEAVGRRPPGKRPVYWRARDSLFFEPLVALAIIVVLLVSLFAYTQNWPPVYVVESDSMQHGPNDQLGLINTGDLVLAQKVSLSQITPYVTGLRSGYSTYGEYGDVILYWPNGGGTTPIIHRAIAYLEWNPLGYYNATDLAGLPCGSAPNPVYSYTPPGPGGSPNCDTTHLTGTLTFYDIGWQSLNFSVDLSAPALGQHSGFLTLGDANDLPDQAGAGVPAISSLVEPGWVIGVARGMIPWFGALKLLLGGQAGEVPSQSWTFMGLTIVGVILIAFGIHYALQREGIETPLRREEEEAARADAEAAAAAEGPPRRHWYSVLRRRRSEDDEDEEAEPPRHGRHRPPTSSPPSRRGRPTPHVRRPTKPAKKTESDDEL
jgi:signal peptidase I